MRQVPESAIIDAQPLTSIDHLNEVEFRFIHSLEMWYLCGQSCQIMLNSIIVF